jgi:hypothetical protein
VDTSTVSAPVNDSATESFDHAKIKDVAAEMLAAADGASIVKVSAMAGLVGASLFVL